MFRALLMIALAWIACGAEVAQAQMPPATEAPASGGDITRPLQRFDLRTEVAGGDGEQDLTVTLRHDRPVTLGDGWQANLRMDLPVKFAEDQSGLGDMLVQAIFVRQVDERRGFGFGAQVILPTASEEALGRGQWRLRPTAGYRWSLPEISPETFFQVVARFDFSFAGNDDTPDTRELQFAPNLEIGLPGDAYLSIFPSTDIRYDFENDEFFLPLNLEVGKEWDRIVVSLEGGVGVISGDNAPYDWKLEGRVGLRF
jgi:hypothetical protein